MARRPKNTERTDFSEFDPDGPDYGTGGGGGFHVPPGEYQFRSESCEKKVSKNDNEMYEWVFVGTTGKVKGKKLWWRVVVTDRQKLGKTLIALGIEVETTEDFEWNIDDTLDVECICELKNDNYNGERRSVIDKVHPLEEGEEEEAERPAKGKAKKGKAIKVSEEEVGEMTEEELEDLNDKHDLEINFAKLKTLTRKKNAVIEALTEKDMLG